MKPVLFLVGPTGSGKSELALALAKRLGSEIISADSMQVYRGMDIGTAKPTRKDCQRVPHHLLDLVSPKTSFSVYPYRAKGLRAIEAIHRKKKIPLIVGGSGLYVEAIWKGLSDHPGADRKLRGRLAEAAERKSAVFLYQRLRAIDPTRACEIHPNDRRRIIRALEIAELSGKRPSDGQGSRVSLENLGYSVRIFGIARDRADLYERINHRVEAMFRKGFIKEVKRLRKAGFGMTARQALGYREILQSLEREEKILGGELLPLIQCRTRQFAKRQLAWFRREKAIEWIPWKPGESAKAVCDKIVREIQPWLRKEPFS